MPAHANTVDDLMALVNMSGPTMPHMTTPCWVFCGRLDRDGYGRFSYRGEQRAHRAAWRARNNNAPVPDKMLVLHECDNRACVRHLYLGTHQNNNDDMWRRGRANPAAGERNGSKTRPDRVARGERHSSKTRPDGIARGDRHGSKTHPESVARGDANGSRTRPDKVPQGEKRGSVKLTAALVQQMRAEREAGAKLQYLADTYGVCFQTASEIVRREAWRHVT